MTCTITRCRHTMTQVRCTYVVVIIYANVCMHTNNTGNVFEQYKTYTMHIVLNIYVLIICILLLIYLLVVVYMCGFILIRTCRYIFAYLLFVICNIVAHKYLLLLCI